jgi:hypothetical protein
MDNYINVMTTEFQDKKCLKNRYYNTPPLILSIIELDKLGYTFTINNFNNFISCATYNKKASYISNYQHYPQCKIAQIAAIKIMFNLFTPNPKQFKLLLDCYGEYNNNFKWVNTLIKKNYQFTDAQKDSLKLKNFKMQKLLLNNEKLSMDEIKFIILKPYNNSLLNYITKLLDKVNYDNNFINWLIDNSHHNIIILKLFVEYFKANNLVIFNEDSYKFIFKFCNTNLVYYCIESGYDIINNPNKNEIMLMCASNNYLYELIFYFHKKFNYEITTEIMNMMIKKQTIIAFSISANYPHSHGIVEKLLSFGYSNDEVISINMYDFMKKINIIPNLETFEIGIRMGDEKIFNDCLNYLKIIPTEDHLNLALSTTRVNINIINTILCYKIIPSKEIFQNMYFGTSNTQIIELLINSGYNLDFDDVKLLIKKKIAISNLERFKIKYDEELYFWCYVYNSTIYDDKFDIDKSILDLRNKCKNGINIDYKQYLKDNNLKLDRYCLDYLICYNYNAYNLVMDEYKLDQTRGCYYWMNLTSNLKNGFDKYIGVVGIDKEYMMENI